MSVPRESYGGGRRIPRDRDIWKATDWFSRLLIQPHDDLRASAWRRSLPPGVKPWHRVAAGAYDRFAFQVRSLAQARERVDEDNPFFRFQAEGAWHDVRTHREAHRYIDRDLVAELARISPIPEDLRDYVVDLLLGNVKRPPGPRRVHLFGSGASFHTDKLYDRAWAFRVVRWKRAFEREKARTRKSLDPYRSALAKVSDESGISEDTLDRWLYPRGKVTPPQRVAKLLRTSYDPPS